MSSISSSQCSIGFAALEISKADSGFGRYLLAPYPGATNAYRRAGLNNIKTQVIMDIPNFVANNVTRQRKSAMALHLGITVSSLPEMYLRPG